MGDAGTVACEGGGKRSEEGGTMKKWGREEREGTTTFRSPSYS